MERRQFLKLMAEGALGGAAVAFVGLGNSEVRAAGADEPGNSGLKVEGLTHEALRGTATPWFAPFLAGSEQEQLDFVNDLPLSVEMEATRWNHLVNAQVALIPTDSDKDRYAALTQAVRDWSTARGHGADKTPVEQHWFYQSEILTDDLDLLRAGGSVQKWANGSLVYIDPIQLGSYGVATNIVDTGKQLNGDTVSVYTNPGEGAGIIRARLLPDVTQGEFAVGFAQNRNVDTQSKPGYAPAVIYRGIANYPVRVTYSIPVPGSNGEEVRTYTEDRFLDNVGGTITVHLPTDERLYDGNHAPSVTIRSLLVSADQGEPEAMFFVGSNDVEGDPRNEGKNLITQSEVLPQLLALIEA